VKFPIKLNKTIQLLALGAVLCFCFIRPHQAALAGNLPELAPEIIANSWEENDDKFASVTLNGREIIKIKESERIPNAEEYAEELAARLDDLVKDNKFDPEKLVPSKDGDIATIRVGSATVIKFPPAEDLIGTDNPPQATPLEHSFRVVNAIRNALGATLIPQSFLKLSEMALHDASALTKAAGHFSGAASWYGGKFNGRKTSDGTVFDEKHLTAAHRSLPFGTKLLVMNRKTGDSCVVKVNDRGPFVDGRVIDLSKAAAKQLNMIGSGVATVDCLVLDGQ
jgi:rare lipoprotein A